MSLNPVKEEIATNDQDNQSYRIKFVSQVTGVNAHTIRAWEKRYNAITPRRDDLGRRVYQQDQIQRIQLLNELVAMGNNISELADLDDEQLQGMHSNFNLQIVNTPKKQGSSEELDVRSCLNNLIFALHNYKLDVICHELEKACFHLSEKSLALEIVIPLLVEMRRLKQKGILTPAQTGTLVPLIKFEIIKKIQVKDTKSHNLPHILLAAPTGHLNEMGILIAALFCQNYNLNFSYLGANTPAEVVTEVAQHLESKYVIVGLNYSSTLSSQDFQKYLDELGAGLPDRTQIWCGGVENINTYSLPQEVKQVKDAFELEEEISKLLS